MNQIVNSEECVKKISKYKRVFIYGAGNYGRTLKSYLERFGIYAESFLVSELSNNESNFIDGLSLNEVGEIDYLFGDVVIVAAAEKNHENMKKMAVDAGFEDIFFVSNEFLRYMKGQLSENKLLPMRELHFEVHITEHCNLNCKGCYHFSPLAKPEYLDIEEYRRDIERLNELWEGHISSIVLLGGEPLLHPDIIDFMKISRAVFPYAQVSLLTNGTLLNDMGDEIWDAFKKYSIELQMTLYPVNAHYDEIEQKAKKNGIKTWYHNDVGAGEKKLIKFPFDLSGSQNPEWNYQHCTRSNVCITLKHGRLYTCPMSAHFHLAKDYFGLDTELSEEDFIDIYKAESAEKIAEFLTKPIPFCKYCDLHITPDQYEWSVSGKKLDEWF